MIKLDNISYKIHDETKFSDISFIFQEGKNHILIYDKNLEITKFLKIIARLEIPSTGSVTTSSETKLDFLDLQATLLYKTIKDNINFFSHTSKDFNSDLIANFLITQDIGLDTKVDTLPQDKKILFKFYLILASDCNFLVMDYIFPFLSEQEAAIIIKGLHSWSSPEKTIILVDTDLNKTFGLIDSALVITPNSFRHFSTKMKGAQ